MSIIFARGEGEDNLKMGGEESTAAKKMSIR
jgi:hypothetical protein